MSLLMSDYELQAIDGRRQEAVTRVLRQRHVAALLKEPSSPLGTPVPHRRGIGALSALASGWFGRRHPRIGDHRPTHSTF